MRQLRRFVDLNVFYKKFIPKCAEITRPIYALLLPQRYSKKAVLWNDVAEKAFHEIIAKISLPVTPAYPVKNAPTYLVTDASEIAAGAVLHQKINSDLCTLGFFSRAFNNAQLKYSVFDKELTAIHMAVKHFKYFLEHENSKLSLINEVSRTLFCRSQITYLPDKVGILILVLSILPILFTYLVPLTL